MSKVSDFLARFHVGRELNALFQEAKPTLEAIAYHRLSEVVTANFPVLQTDGGVASKVSLAALEPFTAKVLAGLGPEAAAVGSGLIASTVQNAVTHEGDALTPELLTDYLAGRLGLPAKS